MSKRLVIKLSGESLLSKDSPEKFCLRTLDKLIEKILTLKSLGYQLALVMGGGNIIRGKSLHQKLGLGRLASDSMGMLATVMNCYALYELLNSKGVNARIFTATALELPLLQPFEAKACEEALNAGVISIFGGGLGSAYFTTDSCAALRACEIQAHLLVKVTHVDGIYDKDPELHPDAQRLDEVSYSRCLQDQLNVMDATAFALCRDNNIPIMVCHMDHMEEAIIENKHRTLVKGGAL